ncbi:unnamed protein product, partial [Linum tenue]
PGVAPPGPGAEPPALGPPIGALLGLDVAPPGPGAAPPGAPIGAPPGLGAAPPNPGATTGICALTKKPPQPTNVTICNKKYNVVIIGIPRLEAILYENFSFAASLSNSLAGFVCSRRKQAKTRNVCMILSSLSFFSISTSRFQNYVFFLR